MKRIITFCFICLMSITLMGPTSYAQNESFGITSERAPNLRHPKKPTNRYLENNNKKKKIKTSHKYVNGNGCRYFAVYKSEKKEARLKAIRKRRSKL